MLIDAHCHLTGDQELADLQQQEKVLCLVNCESLDEFELNNRLAAGSQSHYFSGGIHPWHTDKLNFLDIEPLLELVPVVGEIGLDNLWTEVPLSTQRPLFTKQLAYAMNANKPVVLHTKGCEAEVLTTIKQYPNNYLIHWYSSPDWHDDYIQLDCYFTIGVDVAVNPAVCALAKKVPLNRLLIETDGLVAVAWALNKPVTAADYLPTLEHSLKFLSDLRNIPVTDLKKLIQQNFKDFLQLD